MKYFISDLHLGNAEDFAVRARPFPSYQHFEETIMNNICKTVNSVDTLYLVGDTVNHNPSLPNGGDWVKYASLVRMMPGNKVLLLGNNEERILESKSNLVPFIHSIGDVQFYTDLYVDIGGQHVHIVHDPARCDKDVFNLFGHYHFETSFCKYGVNVSCDLNGYTPLSEERLYTRVWSFTNWKLGDPNFRDVVGEFPMNLWRKYSDGWEHLIPFRKG